MSTQQLAAVVAERVCWVLRRKGLLGEANHKSNEVASEDDALDACREVALSRGRVERIDERCQSRQELFASDEAMEVGRKTSPWLGEHKGFSLHEAAGFASAVHKLVMPIQQTKPTTETVTRQRLKCYKSPVCWSVCLVFARRTPS